MATKEPAVRLTLTALEAEALNRHLDHSKGGLGIGPKPTSKDEQLLVNVAFKLADAQAVAK